MEEDNPFVVLLYSFVLLWASRTQRGIICQDVLRASRFCSDFLRINLPLDSSSQLLPPPILTRMLETAHWAFSFPRVFVSPYFLGTGFRALSFGSQGFEELLHFVPCYFPAFSYRAME